ncbi:MAG: PAS domain-containing protein [Eubacteriales bacterium]|nr:PAS domain-containing protein [Eubacteriales bacterium]
MDSFTVSLTQEDRTVLNSYAIMAEGLSNYLGSCYEIVIHSLEDLNKSAIKVLNGFHTNRTEGAPITDLALQMLAKMTADPSSNYSSYFTTNRDGNPLRSTTIAIRGGNNRIIGLLCINFYLNSPMNEVLKFYHPQEEKDSAELPLTETFAESIDELITRAVASAVQTVKETPGISSSLRNREVISILNQQGVFKFKDSVIKVAKCMGISKNTVYLHLRTLSGK